MNATEYIQARLRRGAQTLVYLAVVMSLLMLSGWLIMGSTGAVVLLGFSALLVLVPSQLPISVLMRMRGARRLHPAEVPGLHRMVERLAARAGFGAAPALYLQGSPELQAFATVSGSERAIGVTRALLKHLDPDELEGVLAHEMSHIQSGDIRVMGLAQAMRRLTHSLATLGLLLIPLSLVLGEALVVSPLALMILVLAPSISYLAELGLSRTREYDADLAAVRLTGNPQGLARALYKLEHHQRSMLAAFLGLGVGLRIPEALRTHPPTRERVRRLLELLPPRQAPGFGPFPDSRDSVSVRTAPRASNTRWSVMMM